MSKLIINLDTNNKNFNKLRCKQNDDRILKIRLFDRGQVLDITNTTVTLNAVKPSNSFVIQSNNITKVSANEIDIQLNRDIVRESGEVKLELVLTNNFKQITTFSFILEVEKSVLINSVESSNTVTIIEQLADSIIRATNENDRTENLIATGGAVTKDELNNTKDELNNNVEIVNTKLLKEVEVIANKEKINKLTKREIFPTLIDFKNDWLKGDFINTENGGDWVVSNNSIIPKTNKAYQKGTLALYKKEQIEDGEIGITIKGYNLDDTEDSWLGIVFRGLDINNNLFVGVNPNTKTLNVVKNSRGVPTIIKSVDINNQQASLDQGKNINLVIKFYGNIITVLVNGYAYINNISSVYLNTLDSNGYFGVCNFISKASALNTIQDIEYSNLWAKEYLYNSIPNSLSKILYCGDSNMIGYPLTVDERWSALLDVELKKSYPTLQTLNVARGGWTTNMVLEGQFKNNIKSTYDLVFILAGSNNSRSDDAGSTVESAIDDILYMIRYAKACGVTPIICIPPCMDVTVNTVSYNINSIYWLEDYRNSLIRLCMNQKVQFIDFYNSLNKDLTLYVSDKIHFNQQGHIKLSQEAIKVMQGTNKYFNV